MADVPDKEVLLDGVAAFLMKQVVPGIQDRGLAFRVRIAAHLVAMVARECRDSAVEDPEQIALFAERFRGGEVEDAWLQEHLAARLRVSNPRFSLELETGEDEWTS